AVKEPQHLRRRFDRSSRSTHGRVLRALTIRSAKLVDAHRRMHRRHQECRRYPLPTDVTDRDSELFISERQKVVVITAHGSRRLADAVQFERSKLNISFREELRLYLLRDRDLALQSFF